MEEFARSATVLVVKLTFDVTAVDTERGSLQRYHLTALDPDPGTYACQRSCLNTKKYITYSCISVNPSHGTLTRAR